MAATGWRAQTDARRPGNGKRPKGRISKRRRRSAKDGNAAMRAKGLL